MYSYEERIKAVKLYIKYDQCISDTIRELGYPSKNALKQWYEEYVQIGEIREKKDSYQKYSKDQIKIAVDYYLEHGRSLSRTIRAVGYPTRETLTKWIDELAPNERKVRIKRSGMLQLSQKQKNEVVLEFCVCEDTAEAVAKKYKVSRGSLYKLKKQLLGDESIITMKKLNQTKTSDDRNELLSEVEALKKELYKKQMEIDILNKAAEIIKKDKGINLQRMTNCEKTELIDALRIKYPLYELLKMTGIPKSSYFYQKKIQEQPEKYSELRKTVKSVFDSNRKCYGYRRVYSAIKNKGQVVSEKVIRRIMKEEQIIVSVKKKRKYNSYKGEITPAVENVIARDFHAESPNKKWLTDLTEFHIPAGKVYLSPIIDCFDGMVVSWTIGTSPNAELVNTMLTDAIAVLSEKERPVVHTDRGCHYRWNGWISAMENAQLIRSMSKKGCSPDNSACEGFFGRLKNEMFYGQSWKGVTIESFMYELDEYLKWYNNSRIKMSLDGMSPILYRRSLGLAV
ncbi:IS3 family transposase [Acetobacterium wieringae]|uniref:IS3 family transposase n=1 Tax=Acetobacterium wieringae TaxID=52694 RepID=A0A5D0WPG4_9FIRM|nr:IS3 family transposase [Acetobacterium wieringae]TYC86195.1 IS3 family transposase [Acetobacterium wieringae]UYO62406.1 IS3 family transposase [Acetobacterium wieringae]VUZ26545.1 IS3 family transposase ISBmu11 [Acetobacterium wieringae]